MQNILRKRVGREFRENLLRYLALGFLILLGMYIVVSLVGAADTVIAGVERNAQELCMEDGEFTVFVPLAEQEEQRLAGLGVTLEKTFYMDFTETGSTLRVFRTREKINRIALDEGRTAEQTAEAVLEKRYCEEHGIRVGDSLVIGGQQFQVTGIGSVPDYDAPYRNLSDSSVDSSQFGMAFVTEEAYRTLLEEGRSDKSEEYVYSYRLNGAMTDRELKEELKKLKVSPEHVEDVWFQEYWKETVGETDEWKEGLRELDEGLRELKEHVEAFLDTYYDPEIGNLTQFLTAEDNPRIGASADDQIINKLAGLLAGVIAMVLFTYVISVFVIHSIEQESAVIGALYALGVKRKDLLLHYLMLPVAVTFVSGVAGTLLGYSRWGVNVQIADCYAYFSVPVLDTVYSPWLLAYGMVMPPVTAALVNCIVIRKRLSRPALSLLRNEQKAGKLWNIRLGKLGFTGRFRIRQMLREARTGLTVIFGMFISLLILMIGVNCYVLCRHISIENKADTRFEYMYTFKYPEAQAPEGGEACYAKTLKKEIFGYHLDVTLMGIDRENPYFDAEVSERENEVVISSAMAQKYGLSVGEKVILNDNETDTDYVFTVSGITQYSLGMYAFMDIDVMRSFFGENETYYNVVLSDHALDIAPGRLYATTTREEISKSSDVFTVLMMPMVYMMIVVAALIFCMVMYLMMKVMIDRSAFSISLLRVFGYRSKEIRKLYLNGNFYIIAVGAAICLPISKRMMDAMYPMLISNVACGMNLTFSWQMYLGIYAGILALYFVINRLLVGRLNRALPADVLKNRE